MARKKFSTPAVEKVHPADRAADLAKIFNSALDRFHGQFDELEKAIGMLMMGDYVGWKVLVLIHSKSTLKKYEEILGIEVRQFFKDEGPSVSGHNYSADGILGDTNHAVLSPDKGFQS